jgi:small subunit ribosomal protein S16
VATKIRLMRLGKIRSPHYRIVVADSRTKRDGRVIETIGKYHPKEDPSLIEVDSERARYWLGVGAQPTEPVAVILKLTGDWQAHKGLPAPEHGVRVKAAPVDRKAIFEAAAKETLDSGDATPAKKTAAKKTAAKKVAEAPAAAETKVDSTEEPGDSEAMGTAPVEPAEGGVDAVKEETQQAGDSAAAEAAGDTAVAEPAGDTAAEAADDTATPESAGDTAAAEAADDTATPDA